MYYEKGGHGFLNVAEFRKCFYPLPVNHGCGLPHDVTNIFLEFPKNFLGHGAIFVGFPPLKKWWRGFHF